jgi:hypothetical protein
VWATLLDNLQALALTLAGVGLALLLLRLQERAAGRFVARRLGWRAVLVTGWIGVPVHELSHLLAARLFRHRVVAWRLFDPDPVSGTLGYVRHTHDRRSAYQVLGGLVIGIAPLLSGGLALWALLGWALPPQTAARLARQASALGDAAGVPGMLPGLAGLAGALARDLWRGRGPWLPLQIYLCVCVASHLAPGGADLRGAARGALLATLLLAAALVPLSWCGVSLSALPGLLAPLLLLTAAAGGFQGLYVASVWLVSRRLRVQPAVRRGGCPPRPSRT